MKLKKHQQGHAAILFAMMIPVLFGIFALASDGARALQTKARIEDAAEVAVLAISAHNDTAQDENGNGTASRYNNTLAKKYVNAYINDVDSVKEVKVYKRTCEHIADCKEGVENGKPRFFEHEIEVTTTQKSWFPGQGVIVGMGETFDTYGDSRARKYQSEAVDVMFAADYSGSMDRQWSGSYNKKYVDLRNIINDISEELQKFNDLQKSDHNNTMGIVGYSEYANSEYANGGGALCFLMQQQGGYRYPSVSDTLRDIFIPKTQSNCTNYNWKGNFHEMRLTEKFVDFNRELSTFRPKGGTASYSGIIRGAQLLKEGSNTRRLLIVLSDGEDGGPNHDSPNVKSFSNSLVNGGMCDKIREGLEADKTPDGRDIKAQIVAIGFDYNASANQALKNCVGADNLYKAENADEIKDKILELISEEVGHLK
ncbi:pilus assembly protein [Aliivibrio sp. S4TY2]|uniref:TadE/TadG family type IV pilus assembly protein n=1 Tax=unclassified Aliivibrio TaxID=2645654 RepID=UPI00237871A2|nr:MULTISPECIES: pilus assembly protein [unclassified Aliivibrio]MDD9158194.1 pilus assembly protein [Aliivibrio sp. S4TY2]MDD9162109.1 pilus assembly protein [Aliivibrio sp. S4TY1]MDD9166147.1 pilus assembly protein [Aliivibrio sp. S4MY2]MDD9170145.1 pilus assembly protein [Aliivibrio sp. S4MY4]MDD9187210.1 pilus assembly protein [Aliivibrio sp. S4MY3]